MPTTPIGQQSIDIHKKQGGKIKITTLDTLDSTDKLSLYYTPGVASVSEIIAENPEALRTHTWVGNTVAVVSDGSAVLGLGNIGSKAAMPVMEGKAMIFQQFASINAIPIVLDVHDADGIVEAVRAIAPSFGGINLEDIAAPLCFEVEDRLKELLPIPVFHDDQHGTAIVVLAGLINAVKVTKRALSDCSVVVSGVGSAGVAIMKLLRLYAPDVKMYAVDSKGIISSSRDDIHDTKAKLLKDGIIQGDKNGSLSDAMEKSDIFIGVSKGGLVTKEMVASMNSDSIVFAMANPTPEILPDKARAGGAKVVATGRSDFPNQINNALCFPGVFRGALDNAVHDITEEHKRAAAEALAALVETPTAEYIIPSVLDDRTVPAIAAVIT